MGLFDRIRVAREEAERERQARIEAERQRVEEEERKAEEEARTQREKEERLTRINEHIDKILEDTKFEITEYLFGLMTEYTREYALEKHPKIFWGTTFSFDDFFKVYDINIPTFSDAMQMQVDFGEHRGKTLGQILKKDRPWISWYAYETSPSEMRNGVRVILQKETGVSFNDLTNDLTSNYGVKLSHICNVVIDRRLLKMALTDDDYMRYYVDMRNKKQPIDIDCLKPVRDNKEVNETIDRICREALDRIEKVRNN